VAQLAGDRGALDLDPQHLLLLDELHELAEGDDPGVIGLSAADDGEGEHQREHHDDPKEHAPEHAPGGAAARVAVRGAVGVAVLAAHRRLGEEEREA
ncbi:MAG: hypothetical protein ACK559_00860, partial [bacterium]